MFLFIFLNIKRVQSLFGKHLYHSFYGFLWRDLSSGGAESNRQSSNLPYSLQNTQSLVTAVNRSNNKSWNQSVWLNALLLSFTYDEKWTNYSCQFTSSSAIVGKPLKPFIPKSGCNVWAPGCYVTMFTRAEMKACAEAVHALALFIWPQVSRTSSTFMCRRWSWIYFDSTRHTGTLKPVLIRLWTAGNVIPGSKGVSSGVSLYKSLY